MNIMRSIIAPLTIMPALLASPALADIYLEVDFANSSPNGLTEGNLAIFDETPLSVWMWADEPNTIMISMTMEINGLSFQGIPNTGGDLQFNAPGTADPDNHFSFTPAGAGELNNPNQITGISYGNNFATLNPLPTSRENAWLIYTDFTGTALDTGSGVTAILSDYLLNPGPITHSVISYGLYQTPTPNTTTLFTLAALAVTKRRR